MNPQDEVLAKMQAEKAYVNQEQTPIRGGAVAGCRPSSPAEVAQQDVTYHTDRANKAARAVAFFHDHPEFSEFIELIRSGVIGI